MTTSLQPDTMAATLADVMRRLQVLEATQRSGLNRMRFAWSNGATFAPTTFGTYENGVASGNKYSNDAGAVGQPGYPQLTLTTGKRILILMNALYFGIANSGLTWRTFQAFIGVGIDGGAPDAPGWTDPRMYRQIVNINASESCRAVTMAVVRGDITPGDHQFGMWAQWNNDVPTGATQPQLLEGSLAVLPID